MSFADWLTDGWGEALRNHSIAETFQDVQTFAGDLADLAAQQAEFIDQFNLGPTFNASTHGKEAAKLIRAAADFKAKYE